MVVGRGGDCYHGRRFCRDESVVAVVLVDGFQLSVCSSVELNENNKGRRLHDGDFKNRVEQ